MSNPACKCNATPCICVGAQQFNRINAGPVHECDAPPYAYFEVTDGPVHVRLIHQAFYLPTREAMDDFLDAVRRKLQEMAPDRAIIFWRRRVICDAAHKDFYDNKLVPPIWSARFATSPPLTNGFLEEQGLYLNESNQWVPRA